MEWFRWYNDTIEDKKWRAIGRKAGVPVAAVVAVWAALCENANQSPERGTLANWCAEDAAAALDLDTDQVDAIVVAMRGKVLDDNDRLTGWEKRNPKREDPTATERKRRARSRDVTQVSRTVTPVTHTEREEEREGERETETDSSILKLHARDAIESAATQIIIAANRGMLDNPAIGEMCNPIPTGHGTRQNVLDWLADGVPPEVAKAAVYGRAKEYRPTGTRRQVTSMAYFSGAVLDAHERHKAQQTEVSDGVDDRGAGAETRGAKPGKFDAVTEDGGTGLTVAEMRLRAG